MRTKVTILFLFIILLFLGCKKDETPTQPENNPYSGDYQIIVQGTVGVNRDSSESSGTLIVTIGSDGKFSWYVPLTIHRFNDAHYTSREFVMSGTVSASGAISADISLAGSKIGTASGSFSNGNQVGGIYQTSRPSDGSFGGYKKY